ncbi:hypothetical protein SKAU_G00037320 [Synaphobranchus kaupii]|uniref:Neuronal membrane glycoprotein M6-a n=1 Tax=Synaphobranchus kaupii TaxID=118154 RepID=A0A9Q1GF12_SYNKA|nr:hypothetical protein SKAU_G00037320 [Synaphobranchus kaupii]
MCESNELDLTFHLFICALAGAGAAVIAMIHYLMVLSANWAYVKDACRMQKYEDIKSKEEQELHDIHSTRLQMSDSTPTHKAHALVPPPCLASVIRGVGRGGGLDNRH